ncbi:Diacylglycerol pyrophosphate phosphatase 1 like protein [Verticillium longisporum]|nr:Diacylglycerol pyrophosphate phosphatase 1 like protein [Verticillium longisporum]
MFPHAEVERVSVQWNFIYALFIPLGVLIAWNFVTRASVHKHEVTYLCFGIALVMTSFITDIVKNAVGRPRPDLVARCKPEPGTPADVLVSISVCQLHVFRHESGGRDLSRALVCLVPLLGAALIAISRCEDYRHDVYDTPAPKVRKVSETEPKRVEYVAPADLPAKMEDVADTNHRSVAQALQKAVAIGLGTALKNKLITVPKDTTPAALMW